MNYHLKTCTLSIVLLTAISCNTNVVEEGTDDNTTVTFLKDSAGEKIYHNRECPLKPDTGGVVIRFLKSGGVKDSVRGRAYYSTGGLKHIADCNELTRELALSMWDSESKSIYKGSGEAVDTIYFSYPYPTKMQLNSKSEQKIKVALRTSYSFNKNEHSYYDTVLIRTFYFKAR